MLQKKGKNQSEMECEFGKTELRAKFLTALFQSKNGEGQKNPSQNITWNVMLQNTFYGHVF